MPHSIFNATLRIADFTVPVKLYAAVEPRPIGFRLLHARDRVPVQQRYVHPKTGEEVSREDSRKALVTSAGMVVLRDEELAALEPEPSRDIELLRFVAPDRLDHRWYLRPYYLGPAGEPDDYFALARALAAERKEGIVRWTMRNKLYRGGLRAQGDHLVLISLRSAAELVELAALPRRTWPKLSERERSMARQLIGMLEGELDPSELRDRYAEQVLALVEAKAAGRAPTLPEPKRRPAAASLDEALAASITRLEDKVA